VPTRHIPYPGVRTTPTACVPAAAIRRRAVSAALAQRAGWAQLAVLEADRRLLPGDGAVAAATAPDDGFRHTTHPLRPTRAGWAVRAAYAAVAGLTLGAILTLLTSL
jgi:hypothetical protein